MFQFLNLSDFKKNFFRICKLFLFLFVYFHIESGFLIRYSLIVLIYLRLKFTFNVVTKYKKNLENFLKYKVNYHKKHKLSNQNNFLPAILNIYKYFYFN